MAKFYEDAEFLTGYTRIILLFQIHTKNGFYLLTIALFLEKRFQHLTKTSYF